ncbi:hypothetical protein FBU59_007009 [Linderina macrospora]|uniref:Uncharacterized protein n=1 Tax=Linderina macrospora TaxID=4868 RepID=A0ACC1IY98_9FUNG|nr:hypothetical protein FBU59_007009 [Linderina macrospora]
MAIEKRSRPFAFVVTTNDRSFYFDASSSQELSGWLEAMQRAIDIVNHQGGRESDETVRRQFATASRAMSPQPNTAQNTASDFFSLPTAGNQRRSSGMARTANTLFEGKPEFFREFSVNRSMLPCVAPVLVEDLQWVTKEA